VRGAFGGTRRVIFAVSRTCRIATRMCRGAEPTTSACAVDEPAAVGARKEKGGDRRGSAAVRAAADGAGVPSPALDLLAETGRPPLLPVATTSRADPGCHIHRPGR
jgi:hypothetical protein